MRRLLVALSLLLVPPTLASHQLVAVKTSTESVVSSTSLQPDDNLQVSLEPGMVYNGEVLLHTHGITAGGLKIRFNCPADGTTFHWEASDMLIRGGCDDTQSFPITALGITMIRITGSLHTGSTGGNFRLRWAQDVSSPTATELREGSYFLFTPIQ